MEKEILRLLKYANKQQLRIIYIFVTSLLKS
jgi:hypothetical protein